MTEENATKRTVDCSLTDDGAAGRADWVRSEVLPHYKRYEEHEAGVRLYFDGSDEALTAVAELVRRESSCCSFAEFLIGVEPPYDEVRLTVTGPDGTLELFREGFVERFDEVSPGAS